MRLPPKFENCFSNFGFAKNWNAFEFAPLARPGSYLNKKRSTMEDHQKDLIIKRSRFFRIRKKFTIHGKRCREFTVIFINHFLGKCNRTAQECGQKNFQDQLA